VLQTDNAKLAKNLSVSDVVTGQTKNLGGHFRLP